MSFGTKGCMYNCGDTCTRECMKPNQNNMTAVEWLQEQTRKPEWHSLKRQDIFEQAKVMEEQGKVELAFRAYSEMLSTGKSFVDIVNSMRTFKSE